MANPSDYMNEEMSKNCMATGAVWAALDKAGVRADPACCVASHAKPNTIVVSFPFMKSKYLVTVERISDSEVSDD